MAKATSISEAFRVTIALVVPAPPASPADGGKAVSFHQTARVNTRPKSCSVTAPLPIQNFASGVDSAPQISDLPVDFQMNLVKAPDQSTV